MGKASGSPAVPDSLAELLQHRAGHGQRLAARHRFTPNTDGTYSCGQEATVKVTGIPAAVQLSAVGKSLSDLK